MASIQLRLIESYGSAGPGDTVVVTAEEAIKLLREKRAIPAQPQDSRGARIEKR